MFPAVAVSPEVDGVKRHDSHRSASPSAPSGNPPNRKGHEILGLFRSLVVAALATTPSSVSGAALLRCEAAASPAPAEIRGSVRDERGPVAGAIVRIQTTEATARTDADGRFALPVSEGISTEAAASVSAPEVSAENAVRITAWAPNYYNIGPVAVRPGASDITLTLEPHTSADNPQYAWVAAASRGDEPGHCQACHSDPDVWGSWLPYDEWILDAHGRSAVNPLFLSMYQGADLQGRQSPPTRFAGQRDYGRVPLPPDPNRPYYGPGFKLDFPDQAGNCAACHAPAAATAAPTATDPLTVHGAGAEGVTCDLCHKLWDVRLDPETGLPRENMPGVLSMEFRRPGPDRQLFIGPFDDVAPGDDTAADIMRESRFCAPCHFASFWGVEVYGSYREWLTSSYSDPHSGRTCQDCHMPRRGATHFTRPDKGGLERDPQSIASHLMPGASDRSFLRDAVTLDLLASRRDGCIEVTASVTNAGAGHHFPTDSPLRNMILVVSAHDGTGAERPLLGGPVLPEWTGDLTGRPGRGYAKVLEELWTEVAPTGAYWNPIRLQSDTRLPAEATDRSEYRFADAEGEITVAARLVYRRAFQKLARQKGWDLPDIELRDASLLVPPRSNVARNMLPSAPERDVLQLGRLRR